MIFNHPHARRFGWCDEAECLSRLPGPTSATNSMDLRVSVSRQLKIDHHFERGNIEAPRCDITGN